MEVITWQKQQGRNKDGLSGVGEDSEKNGLAEEVSRAGNSGANIR